MCHLHRIRRGIHSTNNINTVNEDLDPPWPLRDRRHNVGAHLFDLDELNGIIATDLIGRFPTTSVCGYKYIFLLYNYDNNSLHAHPINSRSSADIIQGYNACYDELRQDGMQPVLQRLDNKLCTNLIQAIESNGLDYQLATPGNYRHNYAEQHIQTFKNYFISSLYGTDESFPRNTWCYLIPMLSW